MNRIRAVILAIVLVFTVIQVVPSPAQAAGRCPRYEPKLILYAPPMGWDVPKMSGYMHRESRCVKTARSSTSDSGLLQINDINHVYLRIALGEWVDRYTLMRPRQNIRAAAALCVYWVKAGKGCYYAWGG